MNKRTTLKTGCAALLLALGAGSTWAQTQLKWAHVYEIGEPYHKQALWAAEEIKKRSNGKYLIEVFPASTLGKETEINQGLTLGTVDIIYTGVAFAGRTYPPISIAAAPFMFRDYAHWQSFRNGPIFKELATAYDEKSGGHHVVGCTYYGLRHMTANKPILKPEDMKGMKLRVPDAPLFTMFPKAVGANPTPIAFAEVYLALQNGTVDAQENPLPTIEAKKFFEVQKNISLTGHIIDSLLTVTSGQLWGKLSADEKKIFSDVMQEAAEKTGREIIASEIRLVEEFKKKGNNVITVDKNAFREAVLKNTKPTDQGYRQQDYDRISAIK
jgi:tripartite ATP-independent transporter DctP family solute receptor